MGPSDVYERCPIKKTPEEDRFMFALLVSSLRFKLSSCFKSAVNFKLKLIISSLLLFIISYLLFITSYFSSSQGAIEHDFLMARPNFYQPWASGHVEP